MCAPRRRYYVHCKTHEWWLYNFHFNLLLRIKFYAHNSLQMAKWSASVCDPSLGVCRLYTLWSAYAAYSLRGKKFQRFFFAARLLVSVAKNRQTIHSGSICFFPHLCITIPIAYIAYFSADFRLIRWLSVCRCLFICLAFFSYLPKQKWSDNCDISIKSKCWTRKILCTQNSHSR